MFPIDGPQLYHNKASDCWIYIWVIMDHTPGIHYKKHYILPGGFIGGPNKPQNADSYICVGLSHLGAIQKEGLKIWDASRRVVFVSWPFLAAVGADVVGLAPIAGTVSHNGKHGCRVHCPFAGRHKGHSTLRTTGLRSRRWETSERRRCGSDSVARIYMWKRNPDLAQPQVPPLKVVLPLERLL
jgi:hypothetical protein